MSELLAKTKKGSVTVNEAEILENYRRVGRLLELMKSRARRLMQANAAA